MQPPRKARESGEKRLVVNSDDEDEDDLLFLGSGESDDYTPPVDDGERDAHMEVNPRSSCVVSMSDIPTSCRSPLSDRCTATSMFAEPGLSRKTNSD
jgi:hypothetical protein